MKINGEVILTYNNNENAKLVFDSLEVDNEDYLKSELNDNVIRYKINSEKLGSFLATVDDLIASEIVTEKIIYSTKS